MAKEETSTKQYRARMTRDDPSTPSGPSKAGSMAYWEDPLKNKT